MQFTGEPQTNNMAEFAGLLAALDWFSCITDADLLTVRGDSLLVIRSMKSGRIKKTWLRYMMNRCREIVKTLPCHVDFEWVPREENSHADELADRE